MQKGKGKVSTVTLKSQRRELAEMEKKKSQRQGNQHPHFWVTQAMVNGHMQVRMPSNTVLAPQEFVSVEQRDEEAGRWTHTSSGRPLLAVTWNPTHPLAAVCNKANTCGDTSETHRGWEAGGRFAGN